VKLLKKGAEGDLYLTIWHGRKAVIKTRKKKNYRNSILDHKIRNSRTIREAEIMSLVKSFGIRTPLIFFVDPKRYSIIMQYLNGTMVKDLSELELIRICKKIGRIVGTMHKNGIMHGDLTTSNFILSNDRIFLIDFGLANKTQKHQDFAIDLRLLKEILSSAHAKVMKKAWSKFLTGYKSSIGTENFNRILNLVSVIESRGRYATVV